MNARLRSALIIAAVVGLDRATKLYIQRSFSAWDIHPVIRGFFNIVHTENPGAAFSMLANAAPVWRTVLLVGVSLIVTSVLGVMLWKLPASSGRLMPVALALVFGGALGNLIDRVWRGTVTDFLQVFFGSYEFPSFNVADSAITIGATLMVIELWRTRKSIS